MVRRLRNNGKQRREVDDTTETLWREPSHNEYISRNVILPRHLGCELPRTVTKQKLAKRAIFYFFGLPCFSSDQLPPGRGDGQSDEKTAIIR